MTEKKDCIIRFATPKAIVFRETMGTERFDVKLAARTNGSIRVSSYDMGRYGDEAALLTAARAFMPELIERSLKNAPDGTVMRDDPVNCLADGMKKELHEMGIEGEVTVGSFILDEGSYTEYEKMKSELVKELLTADTEVMDASKAVSGDGGMNMLIDCCRKVTATALGDGHDETVLYFDGSAGEYQIHRYVQEPGFPESHRAYRTDESVYRKVMEKIRENELTDLTGGDHNGMCGGEYVVKFVTGGMVTRVSTANIPYDKAQKLYEVGALLDSCIDREREISVG